jgi:hypothetical protein
MAVKLIYKDLAIGAADDAAVSATPWEEFSSPGVLPFGVSSGTIATCEHNGWGLDGNFIPRGSQQFAFWSTELSGDNGLFANPPQVVLEFDEKYTATGLTLRFAPGLNEYCSQITVIWTQDGVERDRGVFYPFSSNYALENTVEAFNGISIYFEKTNLPKRRLKLEYIGVGIVREFNGTELTSVKAIHEIDLISDSVPINVLDASFHVSTNADIIFQKKQPVEAYEDDALIGVYYVENGERQNGQNYSISCQDAIGVLDLDTYDGGIWLEDTDVAVIAADVVGDAFEVVLAPELVGRTLRGLIMPEKTRREALQQIAFALGACVDTSGTNKIKMFLPKTGAGAEIPASETYAGGKVSTSDMMTDVAVVGYDIADKEPEWEDNVIEFKGKKYECVPTWKYAKNPNTSVNTLINRIAYEECYLITGEMAQERADAIMAYHTRRNVYSAKHILSGQKPGDRATVTMPWGDVSDANVLKMTLTVSGITASDTEFLLD